MSFMLFTGAIFVKINYLVGRIVSFSRSPSTYFPYFRSIPVLGY